MKRPHITAEDHGTRVRIGIVTTHIAPARGYGGIAESTARIAKGWAAAGHAFSLCASDASEGAPLQAGDVGMPADVPVHLYPARLWPRWGLGAGAIPAILRLCRDADAVYISGTATWPTTLAGVICLLLRRPFVISVHGALMPGHVDHIRRRKPVKWLYYRLLTLPTLARARAAHATGIPEADGVRALVPSVPVAVVPNAIDLVEWPVLPPRRPDGGLTIAYVGRLSPEKGILPFLRAWLAVRRPNDRFVIAGSGTGTYMEDIAALAASARNAIDLHGYLPADGVRALMAGSDLVVLPSGLGEGGLRENFGIAVIEAMAAGRPVMVTRGMVWDDLEDLGAGIVFAADDAGARAALERVQVLSPDALAAMGAAGRRIVEERYALAAVADRMWRVVAGPGEA
ncbi:glycosyltransferase [Azospirillum halopraeferens]|uniref:glycosyltransferase n=1 Tax=Azospirillum halopraeferens TaxID=34010 RepID=UPI00040D58DA|nr:glycosyltransferase [Azospirillum halopraeferens]